MEDIGYVALEESPISREPSRNNPLRIQAIHAAMEKELGVAARNAGSFAELGGTSSSNYDVEDIEESEGGVSDEEKRVFWANDDDDDGGKKRLEDDETIKGQRAKEMDPNDIADESHSNIDWGRGVVENRDEDWIGGRSVYKTLIFFPFLFIPSDINALGGVKMEVLVDFKEEGVAVGRNKWSHWKEEKKLGGGAHQGQNDWIKTTGGAAPEVYRAATEPYRASEELLWRIFTKVHGGFSRALKGRRKSLERRFERVSRIREDDFCALTWHNLTKKNKREAWEERSTAEKVSVPVQDAAGETSRRLACVHLDGTASPEKKGRYPEDTKEEGSCEDHLRVSKILFFVFESRKEFLDWNELKESTIRKVVKIPMEEIDFLDLIEMAAENEGAGDYDKVTQVVFFCKGRDLKEEKELDWAKLVKVMKARWGRYRPAPRCTIQELWTAVDGWEKKGGVSSKGDYEEFSYNFCKLLSDSKDLTPSSYTGYK
ncbi:hypothetical protein PPACK8108_LOCUS22450 [Phakopsora pachyrhizi]|uniref:Uncharacterized protein n=1 Tax=Phakopsora pachyrhizi TaxID=170000 RepID=A0AAV0BLW3_PHAPC|nr:hypothetical protein PPACK8108_LOCUS22450 [Phakopsora pachyrhizi]